MLSQLNKYDGCVEVIYATKVDHLGPATRRGSEYIQPNADPGG